MEITQFALTMLRITIGILTIGHGIPKIMGGLQGWQQLGTTFMYPLGITFLPLVWGFLGACTEFFGGITLTMGLATRFSSFCLIIMMIIATAWHIKKGDSFQVYSFPLSLIFVYLVFLMVGGGRFSLDNYM